MLETRSSNGPAVNEGPQVLKIKERTHIIYSADESWLEFPFEVGVRGTYRFTAVYSGGQNTSEFVLVTGEGAAKVAWASSKLICDQPLR